jgi:hypothetical protein
MKVGKCQTPGAVFHISIHERRVGCDVALPMRLELSEDEAVKLEDKIHDAMEEVLKEYFDESR